jgi:hypothetical protein
LNDQDEARVDSPCINVCTPDASERFCSGCFRTLAEIAAWSSASNAERRLIVAAAARRAGRAGRASAAN